METLADTLSSVELCEAAGVTYRQLNYWVSRGLLEPTEPSKGTGHPILFDRREVIVASAIALVSPSDVFMRAVAAAVRANPYAPIWRVSVDARVTIEIHA